MTEERGVAGVNVLSSYYSTDYWRRLAESVMLRLLPLPPSLPLLRRVRLRDVRKRGRGGESVRDPFPRDQQQDGELQAVRLRSKRTLFTRVFGQKTSHL